MIFNHPSAYTIANARPVTPHEASAQRPHCHRNHIDHCNYTRASTPASMIGGSEGPSWSPFPTSQNSRIPVASQARYSSSHSSRTVWGLEEAEEPMPTHTHAQVQAQLQAQLQAQAQLPMRTLPTTRSRTESSHVDMSLLVKEWLLKAELEIEGKAGI